MKVLRFVARLFGWLLTPIVASAASFFGAVVGAMIARAIDNPTTGLIVSGVCALVAAVVVTWFWLQWLRASPVAREVLGVDETGTPAVLVPDLEEILDLAREDTPRVEGGENGNREQGTGNRE